MLQILRTKELCNRERNRVRRAGNHRHWLAVWVAVRPMMVVVVVGTVLMAVMIVSVATVTLLVLLCPLGGQDALSRLLGRLPLDVLDELRHRHPGLLRIDGELPLHCRDLLGRRHLARLQRLHHRGRHCRSRQLCGYGGGGRGRARESVMEGIWGGMARYGEVWEGLFWSLQLPLEVLRWPFYKCKDFRPETTIYVLADLSNCENFICGLRRIRDNPRVHHKTCSQLFLEPLAHGLSDRITSFPVVHLAEATSH